MGQRLVVLQQRCQVPPFSNAHSGAQSKWWGWASQPMARGDTGWSCLELRPVNLESTSPFSEQCLRETHPALLLVTPFAGLPDKSQSAYILLEAQIFVKYGCFVVSYFIFMQSV